MESIKLSIITLSLNSAQYLPENFHSVLPYLSSGVEHILIDAGSDDDSRALIQNYAEHFPNVTKIFEGDSGPAEGLNKGLLAAKGDWIGILNSDDFYMPGALAVVLKIFQKTKADIVYGYGNVLIGDENTYVHVGRLHIRNFAMKQQQIFQPSIFFKRGRIERSNLFFNQLNYTCWDAEFICQLLKGGAKAKRYPLVFSTFRIHDNSITGSAANESEYWADMQHVATIARKNRVLVFDKLSLQIIKSKPYIFFKKIYMVLFHSFYNYSKMSKEVFNEN